MKKITSFVLSVLMVLTMFSCLATVASAAGKPATPTLVSVQNATSGIVFKWKKVANADFYRVYRRIGSGGWKVIGKAEGASYTDKTAKSGTTYKYTVKAVDDGVASGFKSGLSIIRLSNPASIKAKNVLTGVTVTWAKVNGATGYRVYRRLVGSNGYSYLGNTTKLTYTDKTAKSGKNYQYTAKATYGKTYSGHNAGAKILFLSAPVLDGAVTNDVGATIFWKKVAGAQKYKVYRRADGTGWKLIATVKGTSYIDDVLLSGKTYKYTVKAVSGDYVSAYKTAGIKVDFRIIDPIENPLKAYQRAAGNINSKAVAGYTTTIKSGITKVETVPDLGLSTDSFDTDSTEVFTVAKGSKDAKDGMAAGNCNASAVKSATGKYSGNNSVITIKMKNETNPQPGNGGVTAMLASGFTKGDFEDMLESSGIEAKDAKISYNNLKIVATLDNKGDFIKVVYSYDVVMECTMITEGVSIKIKMVDSIQETYTDFVY